MAESLISDLCRAVGSKLFEEGRLLLGVPEEALEMGKKLTKVEAVLKAAEQREIEAGVKQWIRELKDVAYDIEDVLDEWNIAQMHMQDESGNSQRGNKSKAEVCFSCIPSPIFCFKQAKSRHAIAHTIRDINKRLDGIDEGRQRFNFPISNTTSINEGPRREATTSYEECTVMRSQEENKVKLIEKLVHGEYKSIVADDNHIPIISIIGMGGIGKTTLAQLVYNDEIIKCNFPKIIWVYVSNTFNEMNVVKAIAEGLHLDVRNDSTKQYVLSKIEGSIRGRKFLLVLDDVWEESEGKWGAILRCLGNGDTYGSRILMTTRNSNFSRKMGVDKINVEILSKPDAWSLFSYYAFRRHSDHRGAVEDIAQKLVLKCKGLPLALQVLGRHMVTKTTRREWDDVLKSKMWDTAFKEEVFNSLAFSYLELPSEAKRCFAFCSIFSKDSVMTKNKLICLWVAQGYLRGRGAHQMEVLGEECFESLVSRSFFRVSNSHIGEATETTVTMHDLVHDFARYISNDGVVNLNPSLENPADCVISTKLRHISLNGKLSESNCLYSNFDLKILRTLFVSTNSIAVLKKLCSEKSYIRALDIDCCFGLKTRDDYDFNDIGKDIHLRYLKLGSSKLTVLPKEICRLPYLQTLDLSRCQNLTKLPEEIGILTRLRHLLFHARSQLDSLPKGLGKLTSLRTLSCFYCSSRANEDCSSLQDLRDLNNLRGELWLRHLNRVADVDEAIRAEIHMKTQIRRLIVEFGYGDASLQSEVLEALHPAEGSIEFLKISDHRGSRCPRWIGKMRYLKEVRLEYVSMEFLSELGMLCFLEKLSIKGANKVKHVGAEFIGTAEQNKTFFPKLLDLHFEDMSNWEHWEGPKEITISRISIMPSLRSLEVENCKALQTLPCFLEYVPVERLKLDSNHLPPVEPAVVDYPKRWRVGGILLPQTLTLIETPFIQLREIGTLTQPEEASELVVQQRLNFNSLKIGSIFRYNTTTVPRWIMDLTILRQIELSGIMDAYLPPLGSLPSLEELSISCANKVVRVGDEFLGISSNNNHDGDRSGGGWESTTAFIVFPRLKKLVFNMMLAWQDWEDPLHGGNDNLSIMPSLCHLEIGGYEKLKSLPHFFDSVPLQTLMVMAPDEKGDMLKIRDTGREDEATACKTIKARAATRTQLKLRDISLRFVKTDWVRDWAKYCKRLRELTLIKCGVESLAALRRLPSLELLRVDCCYGIRHIGKELWRISSLKKLQLSSMHDLEVLEDPSLHQHRISNEKRELCILSLWDCPILKALPSFLLSVTLEELEIIDCPTLKKWWIGKAGQDWHSWKSNIPRFDFPGLESEDEETEE